MIKNGELILFKLEDMVMDKLYIFDLKDGSRLVANNIWFEENIVSRVEFSKHHSKRFNDDSLFIYFFIGNIKVGSIISKVDYVLEETSNDNEYTIRKAEDYDYHKINKPSAKGLL